MVPLLFPGCTRAVFGDRGRLVPFATYHVFAALLEFPGLFLNRVLEAVHLGLRLGDRVLYSVCCAVTQVYRFLAKFDSRLFAGTGRKEQCRGNADRAANKEATQDGPGRVCPVPSLFHSTLLGFHQFFSFKGLFSGSFVTQD